MNCSHESGFTTMAYVPCGYFCSRCETLIFQYLPEPPEVLGYMSADWAWKHKHGRAWTTSKVPAHFELRTSDFALTP